MGSSDSIHKKFEKYSKEYNSIVSKLKNKEYSHQEEIIKETGKNGTSKNGTI